MSVVVQLYCVLTYQCLASISGKLDIGRRVNSKMAGDELGQAANSDAKKMDASKKMDGLPGRCARATSLCVDNQKLFNFDLELHSALFYECGSQDCVFGFDLSVSG